ncbi:MAG: 50S ribosomal protein L27 [Candidatus Wildermuthbacteria bacterium GWA2_46_15]|uniref:Large ribosomal subunit protein bL27 n=1 Tax=Candidatus Wildermuthbacteria bacterium GWA2_46_15 TaxID=1802443 RepID=A0A1G2QR71_9BACT|nr:MAG: 50S ribosomal protein L27 [Candidatus Wildermuthbacteria bacterium GWA2_46_15]
MAKSKSGGSSRLGRSSRPKYLGVKITHNQLVSAGMVVIRQRGTKFVAGKNIRRAGDDTLYAQKPGVVKFSTKKIKRFDGSRRLASIVSVVEEK